MTCVDRYGNCFRRWSVSAKRGLIDVVEHAWGSTTTERGAPDEADASVLSDGWWSRAWLGACEWTGRQVMEDL